MFEARLEDRAEIGQLLARYCRHLDDYDIDAVAQMFIEDYVFDSGPKNGGPRAGRASIVEGQKGRMARWRRTHHQLGQIEIEFHGPDSATGIAYVTAWHQSWNDEVKIALLRYHDTFVHTDGQWLIAERRLVELGVEGFEEGTWNASPRQTPPEHLREYVVPPASGGQLDS